MVESQQMPLVFLSRGWLGRDQTTWKKSKALHWMKMKMMNMTWQRRKKLKLMRKMNPRRRMMMIAVQVTLSNKLETRGLCRSCNKSPPPRPPSIWNCLVVELLKSGVLRRAWTFQCYKNEQMIIQSCSSLWKRWLVFVKFGEKRLDFFWGGGWEEIYMPF